MLVHWPVSTLLLTALLLLIHQTVHVHAQCTSIRPRKEVRNLSSAEWQAFVSAMQRAMTAPRPNAYDNLVAIHAQYQRSTHDYPQFLPWHRRFLRRYEYILQFYDPSVMAPWWHWAYDSQAPEMSIVLSPAFYGGNGDWFSGGGCVRDGAFAGWQAFYPTPHCLSRRYANNGRIGAFYPVETMNALINNARSFVELWQFLEWAPHNLVHSSIGAEFATMSSPNDPLFWIVHAYVDKVYADWQTLHPSQAFEYGGWNQGGTPATVNDQLFPWPTRVRSVMDTRNLCYYYAELTATGGSQNFVPSSVQQQQQPFVQSSGTSPAFWNQTPQQQQQSPAVNPFWKRQWQPDFADLNFSQDLNSDMWSTNDALFDQTGGFDNNAPLVTGSDGSMMTEVNTVTTMAPDANGNLQTTTTTNADATTNNGVPLPSGSPQNNGVLQTMAPPANPTLPNSNNFSNGFMNPAAPAINMSPVWQQNTGQMPMGGLPTPWQSPSQSQGQQGLNHAPPIIPNMQQPVQIVQPRQLNLGVTAAAADRQNLLKLRRPDPVPDQSLRMMQIKDIQAVRNQEQWLWNIVDRVNAIDGYVSPSSLFERTDILTALVDSGQVGQLVAPRSDRAVVINAEQLNNTARASMGAGRAMPSAFSPSSSTSDVVAMIRSAVTSSFGGPVKAAPQQYSQSLQQVIGPVVIPAQSVANPFASTS